MTPVARVFVTGSTGCVGGHIVEALAAAGADVHALVRPGVEPPHLDVSDGRIAWERGTLENIGELAGTIGACDAIVHAAAAWNDSPHAWTINVDRTLDLINLCDPGRCRRVVVFSTASVLGRDNAPLPAAADHGTAYVRSKHAIRTRLLASALGHRLVLLYPTLVFGEEGRGHRASHVVREIRQARRYLPLARWVRATGSFHFMHARDIAAMVVACLSLRDVDGPRELVLGQAAVSFDDTISAICRLTGRRHLGWVSLTPERVFRACRLLGVRLSAWDRYAIAHPYFTHHVTRPEDLGLVSAYPTIDSVLEPALRLERVITG